MNLPHNTARFIQELKILTQVYGFVAHVQYQVDGGKVIAVYATFDVENQDDPRHTMPFASQKAEPMANQIMKPS